MFLSFTSKLKRDCKHPDLPDVESVTLHDLPLGCSGSWTALPSMTMLLAMTVTMAMAVAVAVIMAVVVSMMAVTMTVRMLLV